MITQLAVRPTQKANRPTPKRLVPTRFRDAIFAHVLRNLHGGIGSLILGIHGEPGNGKSFNTLETLRIQGVAGNLISGGELESAQAGRPAKLIRHRYLKAADTITGRYRPPQPAALVIDDIDAGLGDWGENVQYTVNRQTCLAELMHLCDSPTLVAGRQVPRVPIIVTANDLTRLYEPVRRPGRMTLLEWKLTRDELTEVVARIFPELGEGVAILTADFPAMPPAFFAEVRRRCEETALVQAAARDDLTQRQAIRAAMRRELVPRAGMITLDRALRTAGLMDLEQNLKSHLRNTR